MSTVKLAEAKAHLNLEKADVDGELQAMIETAESVIQLRCGPLAPVELTQRAVGAGAPFVLQVQPVISITSLTPVGGTAYDVNTLDVDLLSGTVGRVSGGFSSGRYDIVYMAGRATLPGDLRMAVLELVRHLWDTQRGPTRRPGSAGSDAASNTIPGAAYIFPFRVEQLLVPHTQLAFA